MPHAALMALAALISSMPVAAFADSSKTAAPPLQQQFRAGASAEQVAAQQQLFSEIDGIKVRSDARGIPSSILGKTSWSIPQDLKSAEGKAALARALEQVRTVLLGEGTEELVMADEPTTQLHLRDIRFRQSIRGIPVSDGSLVLTVDDRTGTVALINATFLPDRGLPEEPRLTDSDAERVAVIWVEQYQETIAKRPRLKEDNPELSSPIETDARGRNHDQRPTAAQLQGRSSPVSV